VSKEKTTSKRNARVLAQVNRHRKRFAETFLVALTTKGPTKSTPQQAKHRSEYPSLSSGGVAMICSPLRSLWSLQTLPFGFHRSLRGYGDLDHGCTQQPVLKCDVSLVRKLGS